MNDRLFDALCADLKELGTCVVVCGLHTLLSFLILAAVHVSYDVAMSTAFLVGAVKLFQVSTDRPYMSRVRTHLKHQP